MKSLEYIAGFEAAKRRAVEICVCAVDAYARGAGSVHSEAARRVARAQAEWCFEEISRIEPHEPA